MILIQGPGPSQFNFSNQFKLGPLQQYLNGPQFKWAPNNNIDPGGPGHLNLIFLTNLKMPPTTIFKWP